MSSQADFLSGEIAPILNEFFREDYIGLCAANTEFMIYQIFVKIFGIPNRIIQQYSVDHLKSLIDIMTGLVDVGKWGMAAEITEELSLLLRKFFTQYGYMMLDGSPVSVPAAETVGFDSITVKASDVLTGDPDNDQTVEYAITLTNNPGSINVNALDWQDGLTFNDLDPDTEYFVYARSVGTEFYSTGPVAVSAGITTPGMVFYGISLSQTGTYDFGTVEEGYSGLTLTPLTVTVTNVGSRETGQIYIEASDPEKVYLSKTGMESIDISAEDTFYVLFMDGLNEDSYEETVTVFNDNGNSETFAVSLTVVPAGTFTVPPERTLAPGETLPPGQTPAPDLFNLYGNVNGDTGDEVDGEDLICLKRFILDWDDYVYGAKSGPGNLDPAFDRAKEYADVDGDGEEGDGEDLICLKRYILDWDEYIPGANPYKGPGCKDKDFDPVGKY